MTGDILGTCEWCGEVVAEDHARVKHGHRLWHDGCADRLQNILSFDSERTEATYDDEVAP